MPKKNPQFKGTRDQWGYKVELILKRRNMKKYLVALIIILLAIGAYFYFQRPEKLAYEGGLQVGSAMAVGFTYGTTTVSAVQDPVLLKTGPGVLGRIVLGTPSGTGTYTCYNATTTDDRLRTVSVATSSIQLVTIEAAPENGYLDIGQTFSVGLICDEAAGFDGIYTVLWD